MARDLTSVMKDVRELVDEHRASCLWFLRADYYPETPSEALTVLRSIEKHGDLQTFRRAAALRQWLSRDSSEPSAA